MESYSGPVRRKIKKCKDAHSRFFVDGNVDHLESRNAFVTQEFVLKQIHNNMDFGEIAPETFRRPPHFCWKRNAKWCKRPCSPLPPSVTIMECLESVC